MMNGEIKKPFPHQEIAHAAENLRMVPLAKFRQENTDGLHAFALQCAGDHAGLIVEFFGGGLDTLTGCIGNRTAWRVIQDVGDGGRAEMKMLSQRLKASTSRRV